MCLPAHQSFPGDVANMTMYDPAGNPPSIHAQLASLESCFYSAMLSFPRPAGDPEGALPCLSIPQPRVRRSRALRHLPVCASPCSHQPSPGPQFLRPRRKPGTTSSVTNQYHDVRVEHCREHGFHRRGLCSCRLSWIPGSISVVVRFSNEGQPALRGYGPLATNILPFSSVTFSLSCSSISLIGWGYWPLPTSNNS